MRAPSRSDAGAPDPARAWHALGAEDALAELGSVRIGRGMETLRRLLAHRSVTTVTR